MGEREETTRGFWAETRRGRPLHVNGDPDMSEEDLDALREMADAAWERCYGNEDDDGAW